MWVNYQNKNLYAGENIIYQSRAYIKTTTRIKVFLS